MIQKMYKAIEGVTKVVFIDSINQRNEKLIIFILFFYLYSADSQDNMDISPGDSTPTSEASYSHSSTPNAQPQQIVDGPVLLANARLAPHPSTSNNSQLSYTTSSSASVVNTSSSSSSGNNNLSSGLHSSSTTSASSCKFLLSMQIRFISAKG